MGPRAARTTERDTTLFLVLFWVSVKNDFGWSWRGGSAA